MRPWNPWYRQSPGPLARTPRSVTAAAGVLALLVVQVDPCRAQPQGRGQQGPSLPELDLDKLYKVEGTTFPKLAQRFVSMSRATTRGQGSYLRLELFEGELASLPSPNQPTFTKWVFKLRGKAQVLGRGLMWAPRSGDVGQNYKELSVSVAPGAPRSVVYRFGVHASKVEKLGKQEIPQVLGHEEMELHLIEHPDDKSLRLVLDPASFRRHQASLARNWVEEAKEEPRAKEEPKQDEQSRAKEEPRGKEDARDKDEPKEKEEPRAQAGLAGLDGSAEVTLVRSCKVQDRALVIGFRRKSSELGGRVLDGIFHVELSPTLDATLTYTVPAESGKPKKVVAAYFYMGHKIR
jgi:hypothetical protein